MTRFLKKYKLFITIALITIVINAMVINNLYFFKNLVIIPPLPYLHQEKNLVQVFSF